jgi:hypothetical protein
MTTLREAIALAGDLDTIGRFVLGSFLIVQAAFTFLTLRTVKPKKGTTLNLKVDLPEIDAIQDRLDVLETLLASEQKNPNHVLTAKEVWDEYFPNFKFGAVKRHLKYVPCVKLSGREKGWRRSQVEAHIERLEARNENGLPPYEQTKITQSKPRIEGVDPDVAALLK